jgi:hypothetical protein
MSPELEAAIARKYPALFGDKDKLLTESLMEFGCECSDGWYNLINHVCACIDEHIRNGHWKHEEPYRFFQIKEKYGGLRIYDNGHDDYIFGVIRLAESLSYVTCEVCGNAGRVCCSKTGYWLRTLCAEHAEQYEYRRVEQNEEC